MHANFVKSLLFRNMKSLHECDGIADRNGEIVGLEELHVRNVRASFVEETLGLLNLTLTCADEEGERHQLVEEVTSFIVTCENMTENILSETEREFLVRLCHIICPFEK